MTELSRNDIDHLARLARLDLTDEEAGRFATQLGPVVGYIEQLSEVATEGVEQQRGVTGLQNMLATDVVRTGEDLCAVDTQALVDGAPLHEGRFFVVRAVLGEEAGGA